MKKIQFSTLFNQDDLKRLERLSDGLSKSVVLTLMVRKAYHDKFKTDDLPVPPLPVKQGTQPYVGKPVAVTPVISNVISNEFEDEPDNEIEMIAVPI